jgi:hypothetical protein
MPPLQMVTPERFAALREHFLKSGFNEAALRQRLDVPPGKDLDLAALSARPPGKPKTGDGLDLLIYLFVLGESLPVEQARSFF